MADYNPRIKEIEDELKKTKYNKKTQYAIGLMKAKLAMLKDKEQARAGKKSLHQGYAVKKSGDATVIMIGFPSSGKSTLLNSLTNAQSQVAAYEFTTLNVVPGMMEYKGAKIQVLDVPGILSGAASGKGRGREVLSVMMSADFVIMLIDVNRPEALEAIKKEINDAHLRLNQVKPDVKIKKTMRGGIRIGKTVPLPELNDETIKAIMMEFKLNNADVLIRSPLTADQFIDVVEGNKRYLPGVIVMNKIDVSDPTITNTETKENKDKLVKLAKEYHVDVCISADKKINLSALKDMIFDRMNFIRIYCKEVNKKADLGEPMILRKGNTLRTMCERLHKDFVMNFRFAKVWGKSVKYEGQKVVKLDHFLADGDVVELHIG
ncbi:GTP-binding protein [Candidatus Woesearchaeota archaeon]|nr:GTP-binding protein [Candidatus Woesearchaeota archaeon]